MFITELESAAIFNTTSAKDYLENHFLSLISHFVKM